MELFRIHKTIPFMKYSKILNDFVYFFLYCDWALGRSRFGFLH